MHFARLLAFFIAFAISFGITSGLNKFRQEKKATVESSSNGSIDHSKHWGIYANSDSDKLSPGTGSASCGFSRNPLTDTLPGDAVTREAESASTNKPRVTVPLRVTHKQKAEYTSEARSKGIEGTVTLRVTFLASGGIGSITTVKGLPFGLTEQAIEAARKMRFEPEQVGDKTRSTTRPVSFTFNIY